MFKRLFSRFNGQHAGVRCVRRRTSLQRLDARNLLAGDVPGLVSIGDQTVEIGSPLHIPVDAFDTDSDVLTVTVSVADPAAVEAVVLSGNRSLQLNVTDFGTMVFELFETRAPRPAQRVIDLAESGFYDGILFHRVDDGFVLQAGDPEGDGTGGSDLPDFDDQFHPDLQHNRSGILSFAKTSDDTNNSQFFVTENAPRHLDYNHSIFGQLVEGEAVREAISSVAVDVNDKPIDPVVIESASIFDDTQNAVVMLRAIGESVSTEVTVTVTDGDGNQYSEPFTATTVADQFDAAPYLTDLPTDAVVVAGEAYNLQLEAIDLEDDAVQFAGQYSGDSHGSSASIDPATGEFNVVTADDYTGSIDFLLAVRRATPSNHIDIQSFSVRVASRYLNSADPFDVDGNGEVTAQDALLIINALNRSGGDIALPAATPEQGGPALNDAFHYNVSGDLQISAQDALLVINELARRDLAGNGGGGGGESLEGEQTSLPFTPGPRVVKDDSEQSTSPTNDATLF